MITPLLYDYIKQAFFRGGRVEIIAKSPQGYTRRLFYIDGDFVVTASKKGVRRFICYRGPSAEVAEAAFIDYMIPSIPLPPG